MTFFKEKGRYVFELIILLRNCRVLSVFQSSSLFRIRSCPDSEFLRILILLKVSDPDRQNSSTGNCWGVKAWRTAAGGTMDVPLYVCLFSKAKSTSDACVWTKTFAENFWHHQVGR